MEVELEKKEKIYFFSSLNFQQSDTLSAHPLSPSRCQGREVVTTWREKKSLRVFLAFFSSSKMEREPVPLCCPLCPCSLFPLSASTSTHMLTPHLPPTHFTPVHLAMPSLPVDALRLLARHELSTLLFLLFIIFHLMIFKSIPLLFHHPPPSNSPSPVSFWKLWIFCLARVNWSSKERRRPAAREPTST